MESLKDRVAIITGASRGIGRALALGLAAHGCHIIVGAKSVESSERLPGSIHTVAKEVEALGVSALPIQIDVRDGDQIEAMIAQTINRFGRIDILINNAGALWWKPVVETPAKRFDLVMGVNARAAFLTARAVLPCMIERKWGHIINMSPPIDLKILPGKVAYFISKASITWGLGTRAMWRKPDILVDCVLRLVQKDSAEISGQALLDEDFLRQEGISDFSRYACVPGSNPPRISWA